MEFAISGSVFSTHDHNVVAHWTLRKEVVTFTPTEREDIRAARVYAVLSVAAEKEEKQ